MNSSLSFILTVYFAFEHEQHAICGLAKKQRRKTTKNKFLCAKFIQILLRAVLM